MKLSSFHVLFPLLLCLLLAGCAPEGEAADTGEATQWTPEQIAYAILDGQDGVPAMSALLPDDPLFAAYLEEEYRLDPETVTGGAILYAQGTSAQEVAVLCLAEGSEPSAVAQALEDYLQRRTGAFTGYLPEEAALLEEARVVTRGGLAVLLVCRDPEEAEAVLDRAFTQEPPAPPALSEALDPLPDVSVPEEPDQSEAPDASSQSETPVLSQEPAWQYDAAWLQSAWRQGDWSSLHEKDRAILDACQSTIAWCITDGMSDYEKELAIHDWMVDWGRYDSNQLNHLPDYQPNPDNSNPYGFLTAGVGICSGYTSTFQLFMDLLGIPCISVQGYAYSGMEDHAWNMIQLDGEWYCVDVTWDDPSISGDISVGRSHTYFNVTSEFMRWTDHSWEGDVPEAEGTLYAWKDTSGLLGLLQLL